MGYYTDYDFSNNRADVIEKIEEASSYGKSSDGAYYGIKWYDWCDDMKEVSKKFPDEYIHISGVGEENGDQWKAVFKDGKYLCNQARIVIDDFDLTKLQ